MLKWEQILLCTHDSSLQFSEMGNHGGWLVLGSVYDSEPECSDTGRAFFGQLEIISDVPWEFRA